MAKKSQGPILVPCGTPAGTCRKSETPSVDILTRCSRFRKKSIIQFITATSNPGSLPTPGASGKTLVAAGHVTL